MSVIKVPPVYRRKVGNRQVYYAKFVVDGKRVWRSLKTENRDEAIIKAHKMAKDLATGKVVPKALQREIITDGNLHPQDAWQEYLTHVGPEKSPVTITIEAYAWRKFWNWTTLQNLYEVEPIEVSNFKLWLQTQPNRTGKPFAPGAVRDILRAVGIVWGHLIRLGIYKGPINPFKSEHVPRPKHVPSRPQWLTAEQLRMALETSKASGRDIHLFIALGALAGLRKGEILNLRWQDVDFTRKDGDGNKVGCLTVWSSDGHRLKTAAAHRIVPLHNQLRDILRYYRPEGDCRYEYVVKPKNIRIDCEGYRYNPRKALRTIGEAIGMPALHPHMLRHTFASLLVAAGVNLKKVGGWLGHTSIQTTEIYAHLAPVDSEISKVGRREEV